MTQDERRVYLIEALLSEAGYKNEIPKDAFEQKRLLRALFNVRPPKPASDAFLAVQDAYLQEATREKGVTALSDLTPVKPHLYLWRGDITTLAVDAIVNAANSALLGCFSPNHGCIDNAIHTFSGVQLRLACDAIMRAQGRPEPTGCAKITPGFNLPAKYVLHTVGPIVSGPLTERHKQALAACYSSCLALAAEHGLKSVAFCCISTGVFGFPQREAAEIAVETVAAFQKEHPIDVVFNVFKEADLRLYRGLLQ
ncbi:MAG: protein-ADP-ribose hydrolase [Clostridia bacterium]|nr:protein-ADP-ribose hydrolase [Clostridia bacterium]